MADTQPPAPTDAELDELRQANSGRLNFVTFSEFRTIARAVLAKWGGPQAGAVPLTDEEVLDAFCRTPGIHQFVQAFWAGVRFAEQHHGIKGGQHGTDI